MRFLKGWPLAALIVLALGVGVAIAATNGSDGGAVRDDATSTSETDSGPAKAVSRRAKKTGGDVSGPCDEAEHANDPRCAGRVRPEKRGATTTVRGAGEDVSGPCDEAEHANDPRCTGAAPADDSGRGRGRSGRSGRG